MSDEARVTDLREAKFGIQKVRNSRYVFEYKNIWDPVKKRSKPLYRISVGKIIGNEIIINDDYLARHPQLAQGDFVLKDGKPAYEPKIEAPSLSSRLGRSTTLCSRARGRKYSRSFIPIWVYALKKHHGVMKFIFRSLK